MASDALTRDKIEHLLDAIVHNCEDPRHDDNANVLLVGLSGAGKSSLLNTLNASLTGYYRQWLPVGHGVAQTKTVELQWLQNCGLTVHDIRGKSNESKLSPILKKLPNFYDFIGLKNRNSDALREILYMIVNGYIPPGTAYDYLEQLQKDATLRVRFDKQEQNWKITTVVFVHSCRVPVPDHLIDCLLSVLNKRKETGATYYEGDVFLAITQQDKLHQPVESGSEAESIEVIDGSASMNTELLPSPAETSRGNDVEKQLATKFSIHGAQQFSQVKLTNYSDDSGYDFDPDIVEKHLEFLYHMTMPKLAKMKHDDLDWKKKLQMLLYKTMIFIQVSTNPWIAAAFIFGFLIPMFYFLLAQNPLQNVTRK